MCLGFYYLLFFVNYLSWVRSKYTFYLLFLCHILGLKCILDKIHKQYYGITTIVKCDNNLYQFINFDFDDSLKLFKFYELFKIVLLLCNYNRAFIDYNSELYKYLLKHIIFQDLLDFSYDKDSNLIICNKNIKCDFFIINADILNIIDIFFITSICILNKINCVFNNVIKRKVKDLIYSFKILNNTIKSPIAFYLLLNKFVILCIPNTNYALYYNKVVVL